MLNGDKCASGARFDCDKWVELSCAFVVMNSVEN